MKTIQRVGGCAAAFALLGSVGAAHAATDVTIYGVVDVYVALQKGDRSETKIDSGGLSGSRLGFSASHDLSDGMKVLGKLEAGVAADNGASTQGGKTWGRQSWVGLSGSFGTVSFGRQYTPTFIAIDTDDPFDTGAGSAASSGIVSLVGGSRADNSVAWELPKFGAVSTSMLYSAGESGTGSSRNDSLFSGSVRYATDNLGVGLSMARKERATDAGVAATSVLLSGSYSFGSVTLMGGVQDVRHLSRIAGVDDNRTEYYAGVQAKVGPGSLWAGFGSGHTRNVDGSRASQASVGYMQDLDKGTTLYGVLTQIHNGSLTAYTTDTATGSGPAVSPGVKASALQMGLRYRF
jgi:predicted porin